MIIGILGRRNVGKDTVSDYICNKYNYTKLTLAEPLKEICKILFNFSDEQLYGNKKEVIDEYWKITPRRIFQYFGTDILRKDVSKIIPDINEDFWINMIIKKIKDSDIKYHVISDVRFQNEIDKIRENNGIIIKIERNISVKYNTDNHESENNIDFLIGDYLLVNNGTFKELYNMIDNIMNKHL